MISYMLTDEALTDLDEVWGYIARDNVEAADSWVAKLLDACEILARNPRIGHARPGISHSILFWPIGDYLVIYRILREEIEILAVTQGSRDIPNYLRRRS